MNKQKIVFFFFTHSLISHALCMVNIEQKTKQAAARDIELVTLPAFIQSQRDMTKQTADRLKLYAEQDEDLKLKDAAFEELLAREHDLSTNKQYADAIKHLEFVARYGSENRIVYANYRLADIYYSIKEVQNFNSAYSYLEALKQQTTNTWAKAWALNMLGCMYSSDKLGVKKDYAKALDCFSFALSSPENIDDQRFFSICNIGVLYAYGCGVTQDFQTAREYLKLVAKQDSYPDLKLRAEATLKWLDEQETIKTSH